MLQEQKWELEGEREMRRRETVGRDRRKEGK